MAITIPIQQLGAELRRVRKDRELSLRDVKEITDISASTLSRIERGHIPDVAVVGALADFLGVTVRAGSRADGEIETDEDMVKAIEVHLRANKHLDETVARDIARSYEVVMRVELERRKDG